MNAQKDTLIAAMNTLLVRHAAYTRALEYCRTVVRDALTSDDRSLVFLIGASRVGKSWVAKEIALENPPQRIDGRMVCPVLVVYMPQGVTPNDLPRMVLAALKVPLPPGKQLGRDLHARMIDQLRLAGVRVIIFDEASHLVDVGSRVPPRQASDWFKDLYEQLPDTSLVLTGVPRLVRLLQSNEQLRNRAFRPYLFMPYRFGEVADREQFAGCVKAFLGIFKRFGYTCTIPLNLLVRHVYAATAGHIGILAHFMAALARSVRQPCALGMEQFRLAFEGINPPGDGIVQPFLHDQLDDDSLMRVFATEMDQYHDLPRSARG